MADHRNDPNVQADDLLIDALDEAAVEQFLREQAAAAFDALIVDPSRALSIDAVRQRLAVERRRSKITVRK